MNFVLLFVLCMQPFSYALMRSVFWLGKNKFSRLAKYLIGISIFAISNGLLLVSFLRLNHLAFRLTAAWMIFLLYCLFAALATYVLYRLLRSRMPSALLSRLLRVFAPVFVAILFVFSWYNAYTPVIKHYQITLNKPLAKPLRIGMVADLHLGSLVGKRQLDKLADIMNAQKVDIILMPGDIMDDDTQAYEAEKMQPHLQKLRAPLGVYATLGNHDLFGAEQAIVAALQDAGIRVLYDEAASINGQFSIIGRPDDLDKNRLPSAELLHQVDTQKPVILLDHRPTEITQHADLPIDIQLSGHVHNGQVFPANLLVRFLNRVHYGYEQINQTHFFVTSGYGFWGVPFRLGSQAEVMIIDVKGK
ncbi:MAG: metallophosphoesterase [Neisseria sp.]|nr:metallophosphoesterase [Neisseria sp.]